MFYNTAIGYNNQIRGSAIYTVLLGGSHSAYLTGWAIGYSNTIIATNAAVLGTHNVLNETSWALGNGFLIFGNNTTALGTSAYAYGGEDGDKISISRPNSIVFGTGLNYPSVLLNRPDKYGYFNIGNIGFGDSDTVSSDLLVAAGVDGTFATSGGWTLGGADWTISGGKANHAATGANTLYTTSAITGFTVGKMYVLQYTMSSWTSGIITPSIMGVTFNKMNLGKTVSEIFIANATTGTLTFTPSASGVYSLDNATIKEITAGNLSIGGDFYTNNINIFDGKNIILNTTTGTKIGTVGGSSGQKLAVLGATPIVQQLLPTGAGKTVDDVITVLQNFGIARQI